MTSRKLISISPPLQYHKHHHPGRHQWELLLAAHAPTTPTCPAPPAPGRHRTESMCSRSVPRLCKPLTRPRDSETRLGASCRGSSRGLSQVGTWEWVEFAAPGGFKALWLECSGGVAASCQTKSNHVVDFPCWCLCESACSACSRNTTTGHRLWTCSVFSSHMNNCHPTGLQYPDDPKRCVESGPQTVVVVVVVVGALQEEACKV